VDLGEFRKRVLAGINDVVAAAEHEDTVAVFSHGGVINVLLHEVLRTPNPLSFPIDYASVTLLRYSRKGSFTVGGVNGIEHVWDLLPHRQR
jgi:probable phosphoglycerate mutase